VGDNLYADIGGAQAVGIHGVWIHRDRLELHEGAPAVPDRVIGHLADLREALEEGGRPAASPGEAGPGGG
jgi:FMN phosphatase YigB (HAD superfamily)